MGSWQRPDTSFASVNSGSKGKNKDTDYLAKLVAAKINDGDVKGAVRLACSDDVLAPHTQSTLETLRAKHPPLHPDSSFPVATAEQLQHVFVLEPKVVLSAIRSFPNGSSGGIDGLKPQHLKDLSALSNGVAGKSFLIALAKVGNLMLAGDVPDHQRSLWSQLVCPIEKGRRP